MATQRDHDKKSSIEAQTNRKASTTREKVVRKTKWFLRAIDGKNGSSAHGNELIASALQRGQVDDKFSFLECADGVRRHLYEVDDYSTASRFYKSQKDLKANFEIFRSQNGGLPREWKFLIKEKVSPETIRIQSNVIKLRATMPVHRKR